MKSLRGGGLLPAAACSHGTMRRIMFGLLGAILVVNLVLFYGKISITTQLHLVGTSNLVYQRIRNHLSGARNSSAQTGSSRTNSSHTTSAGSQTGKVTTASVEAENAKTTEKENATLIVTRGSNITKVSTTHAPNITWCKYCVDYTRHKPLLAPPANKTSRKFDYVFMVLSQYGESARKRREFIRRAWANHSAYLPLQGDHFFIIGELCFRLRGCKPGRHRVMYVSSWRTPCTGPP